MTAIVLVDAESNRIPEVAEEITLIDGVSEAYSTTGDTDLIAIVRVADHDRLADVIANRLNKVPGVINTKTYIAFRAYSKHDLEAAFHIGID